MRNLTKHFGKDLKRKINEFPQDMAAVLLFWDTNIMNVTL